MAINVYGWRKPTLELELVEGGTLLANTKYYVKGLMKYNSSSFLNCGSCMTDTYEITTTNTAKSIKITQKTYRDITAFAGAGAGVTTVTSTRHCLKTGDVIKISTGSYAGTWAITKVDAHTFTIPTVYVDNVAVQCYTDSIFYNLPNDNYANTITAGMAYHVHTIITDNSNTGNYWTRRDYTDAAHSNPYIVTAQPTSAFNYSRSPAREELNSGIFKAIYEYGCPFITVTASHTLLEIYNKLVLDGFGDIVMYNSVSHLFMLKGSIYVTATGLLNAVEFNIILVHGEIHCGSNDSNRINLYNCSVNWPLWQSQAYINLTGYYSIFKAYGNNHLSSSVIAGIGNKIYISLVNANFGSAAIPWINLATGENRNGVLMENIEIYDNTFQNNYNGTFFRNCTLPSIYQICSVNGLANGPDTIPNIYTAENCYMKEDSLNCHFRCYSHNVNAHHKLKFLNINTDNSSNITKFINNSSINLEARLFRRAKFYIKNQEGIAVEDADINITDSVGNAYSGSTDASGYTYIDCLEQFTEFINKPASTVWNPIYDTFYTDFTITITKAGYENEIIKIDKLYQDGQYDTILNVSMNTIPVKITNVVITNCSEINATNGQISIIAEEGIAPYEYSIDGTTWQSNNVFTGLIASEYTIYVRDSNSNTINITGIKVTEPPYESNPVITDIIITNPRDNTTTNGSIEVTGTGLNTPLIYSIDGVNYQSSGVFNLLLGGEYTVYVKDSRDNVTSIEGIKLTPNITYNKYYTKTPSLRDASGNISKNKILKNLLPVGSKLKTKTILTIQE